MVLRILINNAVLKSIYPTHTNKTIVPQNDEKMAMLPMLTIYVKLG